MALPLFYIKDVNPTATVLLLSEETSKHIIQVLRMHTGELLQLTNGKGNLFTVQIKDDNRKKCQVTIIHPSHIPHPQFNITIAISPTKNNSLFEWFLEKTTEIGVAQIVPLICERSEKQYFKYDRMNSILVSAMQQSQQVWLPKLYEPKKLLDYINEVKDDAALRKFIAHCEDETGKIQLCSPLINYSITQPANYSTTQPAN